MPVDHHDTVAVVTGGSQGLGFAIAERLIADGCRAILISGRDQAKGARAAADLSSRGAEVRFVAAEMGDPLAAGGLIAAAAGAFGRVTALVNAAAVTDRASILDCTPAEWDRQMGANAKGPFFAIQALAQAAIAGGHPASVVNILSVAALCGQSFLAPYAASKAALLNVTKNAANALARHRIRVNGINVGWMDTPGEDLIQKKWHAAPDDWLARAEAAKPFGSLVKPPSVAGLVSYLLSDDAGVMTGSIIDFDQHVTGAYPE
jgi:NAD(P)-dependent dehydrogenase (short-subunit alcohol dehydrogenase family)